MTRHQALLAAAALGLTAGLWLAPQGFVFAQDEAAAQPAVAEPAAAEAAPPAADAARPAAPPASEPDEPISKDPSKVQLMNNALKELIAEAKDLDRYDVPEDIDKAVDDKRSNNSRIQVARLPESKKPINKPHFKRPHPALANWGEDMAEVTLRRMLQSFTGNEYRDTYIRWHLMHVVQKASNKRGMGQLLVRLIKVMPGPLQVAGKQEYRDVPADIAAEWHRLASSGIMVIGFPPFQRRIGPPESYKYMDAAKRRQVEENLARAEELRPQWKRIVDQEAVAFNNRIREVNWIVRQYRGELIYSMLETGEPAMLKMVTGEIGRQTKLKTGIGFDLLSFMYLAAFDGVLDLYDERTLAAASKELENYARGNEGYVKYGGTTRNFADYAFHMIYMLKELDGISAESAAAAIEGGQGDSGN